MKILGILARGIFVLCFPLLLLSASIGWGVNSFWLYNYGFEKYRVGQTTGLAPAELDKAASGLISYFNSGEEYVSVTVTKDGAPFELFTTEEAIHFRDVKGLVRLDYYLLLGTFVYVLGYGLVSLFWRRGRYRRRLARSVVGGGGFTLALMALLGLGVIFSFNWLFLQFHFLSFSNEFWSAEGYMLLLFPGGFWYDATSFCVLGTIVGAVVLAGGAGAYLKLTKSKIMK
ncbi:DUF1461 domain-containing protein [Chloroflexota bacterium]